MKGRSTVTTTEDMATLAEIERGLRERLAELTTVRDRERSTRERAKDKIADTARTAASNNGIGERLDDLLVDLGLEPRPLKISRVVDIVHRQAISGERLRDMRTPQPWVAYQNLEVPVMIESTTRQMFEVDIPRDHDGCACTLDLTDEVIAGTLGYKPEGVERVSITPVRCAKDGPPWSNEEGSGCATVRTRNEMLMLLDEGEVVRQCRIGSHAAARHRHLLTDAGGVTYHIVGREYTGDFTPMPGEWGIGDIVGQPVTPPPEAETDVEEDDEEPVDTTRVQECEVPGHRAGGIHAHWDTGHSITYSDDLDYESETSTRVPGVFSADADLVGGTVA
jgi:hypothetical protein